MSSVGFYDDEDALSLAIARLIEEFKCAKTWLEMTLRTGTKWQPKEAIADVEAALRHT